MSEPRQTFTIKIPSEWDAATRVSFGKSVIREIQRRTEKGIDKNGNAFKHYSDSYANSLDFAIAGKSKSHVNLRLTGEMMNTIEITSHASGVVNIGFKPGTDENDKAAWAAASDNGPSRQFLGLPNSVTQGLIDQHSTATEKEGMLSKLLDRFVEGISRSLQRTIDDE